MKVSSVQCRTDHLATIHKFELDRSDRSVCFGHFAQAPAQSSATSGADAAPQDVLTSPDPSLHRHRSECSECSERSADRMAISKPSAGAWPMPWPMPWPMHCRAKCCAKDAGFSLAASCGCSTSLRARFPQCSQCPQCPQCPQRTASWCQLQGASGLVLRCFYQGSVPCP